MKQLESVICDHVREHNKPKYIVHASPPSRNKGIFAIAFVQ